MSDEQPRIQIHVDPDDMIGEYANLVGITHSAEEFYLDFMFIPPHQNTDAMLLKRLLLSPAHAKRLTGAMQDQINKFESVFGAIGVHQGIPEVVYDINRGGS